MSRDISATNLAEIDAPHLHVVILVKLEFDTPAYCHSGIGTITYDGDDYLGVGQFGSISDATETERLEPNTLTLTLSGIDAALITEALDAGNYGDPVSIFIGYRNDDGTLVADPWLLWEGFFEFAAISQGEESVISITVRHDLSVLDKKNGGRYTNEDQQLRYSGDTGFEFIAAMANVRLVWGGKPASTGGRDGRGDEPPIYQR